FWGTQVGYSSLRARSLGLGRRSDWLAGQTLKALSLHCFFSRTCRAGCDKELRVLIREFLDRIVGRRAQVLAEINGTSSLSTRLLHVQPTASSDFRSRRLRAAERTEVRIPGGR